MPMPNRGNKTGREAQRLKTYEDMGQISVWFADAAPGIPEIIVRNMPVPPSLTPNPFSRIHLR